MPQIDPVQGWTTPDGLDIPDGAAALASLRDQAVKQSVMVFTNAADRDAKIAVGDREAGMIAYLEDTDYFYCVRTDGGSWSRLTDDVFTGEAAIVGATPPVGTPKIRQEKNDIYLTNGAGGLSVSWGTAYANGITSFSITPWSQSIALLETLPTNVTLSQWNGVAWQLVNGASVGLGAGFEVLQRAASVSVQVNLISVGW